MVVKGYRGPERRLRSEAALGTFTWIVIGGALAAVCAMTAVFVLRGRHVPDPALVASGRSLLCAAAAATAVACAAYWRATGRAHGLHVAVGVAGAVVASISPLPPAVRLGGAVVAFLWMGRAVLGPDVDSTLRWPRELLRAGAVLGAVVAVVGLVAGGTVASAVVPAMLGVGWTLTGVGSLVRARTGGWPVLAFAGVGALALGAAGITCAVLGPSHPALAIGPPAAALPGLLVMAAGCIAALADVASQRRGDVHGALIAGAAERDLEQRHHREFVHAIRNRVMAIDGAGWTLGHFAEELDDDRRRELQEMLAAGIAELRTMTTQPSAGRPGRSIRRLDRV